MGIRSFFDAQMRAAVVGGAVASIIAGVVLTTALSIHDKWTQPPSIGAVTSLMQQEVAAGKGRDAALANRIYAPDAVVTDAACGTQGRSQTWKGYTQVDARYRNVSGIVWVQHVTDGVTWYPNNNSASTAWAAAETVGVLAPAAGNGNSQSIVGHELWTFARANGQWRITSFTYNLCLPPSGGV